MLQTVQPSYQPESIHRVYRPRSRSQDPAAQASASQASAPPPTSKSEGPLGTFDILNVPSRVMTPPRSLPLDTFSHEQPELLIDEVFGREFEQKALESLSL